MGDKKIIKWLKWIGLFLGASIVYFKYKSMGKNKEVYIDKEKEKIITIDKKLAENRKRKVTNDDFKDMDNASLASRFLNRIRNRVRLRSKK